MPEVGNLLMKHIRLLPLWSNVCHDKFGYGRVPATTAPCEGEWNKYKNGLLKHESSSLRPDVMVDKHLQYLQGRLKKAYPKVAAAEKSENNLDKDQEEKLPEAESLSKEVEKKNKKKMEEIKEKQKTADFEERQKIAELEEKGEEVEKEEEIIFNSRSPDETECPTCKNGHFPEDAHKCAICERAVHTLKECS